jgi:uncharacterized membrane protein
MLIGSGMGGFVDGIMLHQMAQWHNMLSNVIPPHTRDDGISANLLYGFERFILQSVQSGHVKMTFSAHRHSATLQTLPFSHRERHPAAVRP